MEEEIKKYLTEHLKIELYQHTSCDEDYIGVRLLLDDEEISSNSSFARWY